VKAVNCGKFQGDACTQRFYNGEENILNLLYTYMNTNENDFRLED
jgi:hypothetical protein